MSTFAAPQPPTRTVVSRYPWSSQALEHAATLLTAPSALVQLNHQEALVVMGYMSRMAVLSGQTFIKEGDARDEGFMALVMSGEVIVESITVSRNEPVTMKVLGPGSLVGEVGLVDRDPRTASVTASTDVLCAILSRDDLAELIGSEPSIGAKLMLAIAARMAERMRDTVRKLRLYTKLAKVMQEEIDTLLRVPVARRGADASDAEAHVLAVTNWREHERRSEPRSEPFSG